MPRQSHMHPQPGNYAVAVLPYFVERRTVRAERGHRDLERPAPIIIPGAGPLRHLSSPRDQGPFYGLAIGQRRPRQNLAYWRGVADHIALHAIYKPLERTFREFGQTLNDRRERPQDTSREVDLGRMFSAQNL